MVPQKDSLVILMSTIVFTPLWDLAAINQDFHALHLGLRDLCSVIQPLAKAFMEMRVCVILQLSKCHIFSVNSKRDIFNNRVQREWERSHSPSHSLKPGATLNPPSQIFVMYEVNVHLLLKFHISMQCLALLAIRKCSLC